MSEFDELYIMARRVLLDALRALGHHRDAIVLVGAQAVYLRVGAADLAVTPYTTDGDLVIDPAVLAEIPFFPAREVQRHAPYVLASCEHWRPLVNGYSGFTPPAFVERAERLRRFPEDEALAELRRLGVTHVVVHFERFVPERASAVRGRLVEAAGFTLVAEDPAGPVLYRFRAP